MDLLVAQFERHLLEFRTRAIWLSSSTAISGRCRGYIQARRKCRGSGRSSMREVTGGFSRIVRRVLRQALTPTSNGMPLVIRTSSSKDVGNT